MARVMPSQVMQTIDELFPHAASYKTGVQFHAHPQLQALLNLVKDIPDELINVSSADYADLVIAKGTIDEFLAQARARGTGGPMALVKGFDVVTTIRRVLEKCPDEYPPPTTTELLFIKDEKLRDSIRQDIGAATRALNNAEWKAATVLAGATIEALLHWRLKDRPPDAIEIDEAVNALTVTRKKPFSDIDHWDLDQFVEVAAYLDLLTTDTCTAARLAKNFRNLIHPGRAARLAQTCDRATAYSAIGALEHVIRDLSQVRR
jgi:hypothetical protein